MDHEIQRLEGHDFSVRHFGAQRRRVFERGHGPSVLVLHELPGLSPPCVRFALRLVDRGFRVHMPLLFGEPLDDRPLAFALRLCVSREFACLRGGRAAPIADELRALAADIVAREGGRRIGVIGMCLTGGFVIPLVIEPGVAAGVMSQPSIPYRMSHVLTGRPGGAWMSELNVSPAQLDEAVQTTRATGKRLLVQRIRGDRLCPAERLQHLQAAFGAAAELHEDVIERPISGPLDRPHALLTNEYEHPGAASPLHATRVAFERVVAFLALRLGTPAGVSILADSASPATPLHIPPSP